MKEQSGPIVIVGNGVAGNSAAAAIREKQEDIPVIIISQESVPEYSACALSKKYIAGEMKKQQIFLKRFEDYSRERILLRCGQRVTRIDPQQQHIVTDTHSIKYHKLILATGGSPVVPASLDVTKKGVFFLKSLEDAEKILHYPGRTAVIVGAGAIGIEASISLRKRGWSVSVVELMDRVLPTMLDEKPSLMVRQRLETRGVAVYTSEKAVEIRGDRAVQGVVTDKREIPCDMLILTLGMRPEVELCRGLGVEIGSLGGIKVDEMMRTSITNIYACGDCVETRDLITGDNILCMLWFNAKLQGQVAGYNAVGWGNVFPGGMNISGVSIAGLNAVSIGLTVDSVKKTKLRVTEGEVERTYYRVLELDGVPVGVQVVGELSRMAPWLIAVRRGTTLERIRQVVQLGGRLSVNPWYHRLYPFMDKHLRQHEP